MWAQLKQTQGVAIQQLQGALKQKRIAHAYLFSGPGEKLKREAALLFAQALNCTYREEEKKPCGACTSCLQISRGVHPEVQVIAPEGANLKIQQVRELQKRVFQLHAVGHYGVFILETAEKLTLEAANCLLKILEEPPPQTIFILLAERVSALPATVISRCQEIRFLETRVSFSSFFPYLARLKKNGAGEVLKMAEELEQETNLEVLLGAFAAWYRDLLVWKLTKREDLLFYPEGKAALELGETGAAKACAAINKAVQALRQHANPRLTLEALLFQLLRLT